MKEQLSREKLHQQYETMLDALDAQQKTGASEGGHSAKVVAKQEKHREKQKQKGGPS